MVTGLNVFRDYFADDTDKYVLIGGAACDIVFTSNDATFRATKDLDMVLIVEALRIAILLPENLSFSDLLNLRILHTRR